jgi:hypothetical protein
MIGIALQGILTKSQREMGMRIREIAGHMMLFCGTRILGDWDTDTVTFATIQQAAYQQEQQMRSGIEFAS